MLLAGSWHAIFQAGSKYLNQIEQKIQVDEFAQVIEIEKHHKKLKLKSKEHWVVLGNR